MSRLEALADAIRKYEGWFPLSRSWRNNNPGNLRWSRLQAGRRGGFAFFHNYASGWLGLWYDLWLKCTGKTVTRLNGDSTLRELFEVWAPESDNNNPYAYALWVAKRLNIRVDIKLRWFLGDLK